MSGPNGRSWVITILHPEDHDTWLRGSYDEVVALKRPYEADAMTVRGPVFPTRQDHGGDHQTL